MKIKFKASKITGVLKKIPLMLAEHSFLTILVLFIVAVAWGAIIFFRYNKLVQNLPVANNKENSLRIEQRTYDKVQETWKQREETSSSATSKIYPNLFK